MLEHGLAWSAAGGTYGYPRPYQVCPWDSDATSGPAFEWDDLFPANFKLLVRQFMNRPRRKKHQIHSRGYYDAIWRCMYDTIRRDPELSRCSSAREYVENVIQRTMWWKEVGWKIRDQAPTPNICFSSNDPLDDEVPTSTSKREGTLQPQATGQRKKSNIGSGSVSSSGGQGLIHQTHGETALSIPKATGTADRGEKSRRIGEKSSPIRISSSQSRTQMAVSLLITRRKEKTGQTCDRESRNDTG
jgi:hypothetical protein